MEKIAVFVDDAPHAARQLAPLAPRAAPGVQWVVVACAPRLPHHAGRWLSEGVREQWRQRWAHSLRERLAPAFPVPPVEWLLARGPLPRQVDRLRVRFGADLRVLDLRAPRVGGRPVPLAQTSSTLATRWPVPVAAASGLSLLLALTD
jgi:hypothetical protein